MIDSQSQHHSNHHDGKSKADEANSLVQEGQQPQQPERTSTTKLYNRRWLMLAIFFSFSLTNAYQWIHLNILFDVVTTFYNESLPDDPGMANVAIDGLAMLYMVAYLLLIWPAAWLLGRYGLKFSSICATTLNFVGALIKCFAVQPGSFWYIFAAQSLCAIAQNFILGVPAPLAATWFGAHELSRATAMGVFGNQLGVALGFLIPPIFVQVGELDEMESQLRALFIGGAAVSGVLLLLVIVLFQKRPNLPPSLAQLKIRQAVEDEKKQAQQLDGVNAELVPTDSYLVSMRRLMTNRNFAILAVTYGVNTGCYYAISTLLNPIVAPNFVHPELRNVTESHQLEQQIGWAGFTMMVAGIAGAICAGVVLDKTGWYKGTTLLLYIFSCLSTVLFTLTLPLARMWLVFVSIFLAGFFMTGYLPVGFEFAAEITYPENEGLSSGILNASAQVMGISTTLAIRAIVDHFGTMVGNIILCVILAVGIIATAFIKSDLRRQRANITIPMVAGNEELKELMA